MWSGDARAGSGVLRAASIAPGLRGPLRQTGWRARAGSAGALLYVLALTLLTALAVYVYQVAWQREPPREVSTNARPASAIVPAPSDSSGPAMPAEPLRASEPGPAAAVVSGPPEGAVQRPVDPPPTARPAAPQDSEPGPAAAVAPGPPVGSDHRPVDPPPTARPAAPRASEPGPAAVAVPGPPEGSVQPAPVPPAPFRPLPRPAAAGTTGAVGEPCGRRPGVADAVGHRADKQWCRPPPRGPGGARNPTRGASSTGC